MSKIDNPKVAFLGPTASYCHAAAIAHFGDKAEFVPMTSEENVFLAVFSREVDHGVALIENSFGETARRTLDLFVEFGLKISQEIIIKPSLHLMTKSNRTKIKRIYATPDVASLCRVLLERDMAGIEVQRVLTTSIAAGLAAKKRACAAIAGEMAAEHYKLVIRKRRVQDDPDRKVRFLVISREDSPTSGNDKTFVFMGVIDKPGTLFGLLEPLKNRNINITRFESRPAYRSKWDYYVFIEFMGHKESQEVINVLDEIRQRVEYLVVLGSFPVSEPTEM